MSALCQKQTHAVQQYQLNADDFIDQRLHVEVIGWRNADTPTGFFDRTGNDRPNGGYFCPQQTLSQRLFGLICLCH